jgi:cell division control protein 7
MYDNECWTGVEPSKESKAILSDRHKVKVALKKILVTSSPARIYNELHILESLRWVLFPGHPCPSSPSLPM